MRKASMQLMALSVTAAITFSSFSIDAFAANNNKVTSVMPQAGITYALGNNQVSLSSLQESVEAEKSESESSSSSSGKSSADDIDRNNTVTDVTPLASTVTDSVLSDIQKADNEWNVVLLRYFNPIGAHKSGTIGENPNGIPNNLMPYITQVAVGKLPKLNVFGSDYDTHDGTGVRDYIHVVDLAVGHVKALKKLEPGSGLNIYNLGTGVGYSVLDIVKNFEEATGVKIPYEIQDRRPGDIATCYSKADKAEKELGWKAENGIKEMCADSWRWQSQNPNGYED